MTFNFQTQNIPVVTLGKRKYLVIFLHGYGSNGRDMADFTTVFHHALADAVFICPNAPHPMMYGGYQWFPLSDLSKRELDNGAKMSAPWLNDFIDAALKHYDIAPENLILGGFSQGAMMSLYTGLRRKISPLAILAFSGALTSEEDLAGEITVKPPVLICHGADDDVVFCDYAHRAEKMLLSLNVPVQKHIFNGYAHTIPPKAIGTTIDFLQDKIKS